MKNLFEKYKSLPINSQLICLEQRNAIEPHFCYPNMLRTFKLILMIVILSIVMNIIIFWE